jgi:superfamily II DNA/RNA helicase
MEFKDLGLSTEVLKAVTDSGYTTPTPIQEKAIPEILKRRDLLGIAQTGTGKTAGFTLPMIDILAQGRPKARMPRTLILEPTRELAAQVAESFERYGKYHKLSMALLIGGVSFEDQDRKLDRGVDVLIATPGRLLDHFGRGKLMLNGVQILVIDEADRMLDMGFIPDIERIVKLLPFTRQTLFFSATMPPEITRLVDQFLHNPVRVEASRPATAAETITQSMIVVTQAQKREALRRLIRGNDVQNGIVFCNRKRDVDVVYSSLKRHGFSVGALHGDLDQHTRTKTLDAFRANEIQLLVASDVAARGLDIPAVSHVFNFDVPFQADDYIHRIGRTGRAGRAGAALMISTPAEGKLVTAIEKLTGKTIERMQVQGLEAATQSAEDKDDRRSKRGKSRKKTSEEPRESTKSAEAESPRRNKKSQPKPRAETRREEKPQAAAPIRAHETDGERDKRNEAAAKSAKTHAHGSGLGDHVPAFLLKPVPEKIFKTPAKKPETV